MKVSQIMEGAVKSYGRSESLNAAAKLMWDYDCGCVPVVNEQNEVVGLVTDRDICLAAYTQGRSLHETPIETAMAHKVISCRPEDDIAIAQALMKKTRFGACL